MTTICNKTRRPLSIPLPGGKTLHLSPGKTGEIAANAVDHPPLAKLVAAGELEVLGGRRSSAATLEDIRSSPATHGRRVPGGVRHTGDR